MIRHRDLDLDRYDLPRPDYRLEDVDGRRYYAFPLGTSILSIPYVAAMRLRGASPIHPDGSYDFEAERRLDARLAAVLMAMFAGLVYLSARLVLPGLLALAITFFCAFGTQVFSTTSRALWSDSWGLLLVGASGFLLLRSSAEERPPPLFTLGTLAAWAYIVRPTNVVFLILAVLYLVATMRAVPWRYLTSAAAWLALFAIYSWRHFHRLVPSYYAASRLDFKSVAVGLAGNLVSPSRGLLVCVPLVAGVGAILVRYRRTVRFRPLLVLALAVIAGHLTVVAGFGHWWGGHCFGARLTAGLVPWIVVLAIIGLDAWRASSANGDRRFSESVLFALVGALSGLSLGINSVGAFSNEARNWNVSPNIDETPERLWSWRKPQFLAPLLGTGASPSPTVGRPPQK